MLTHHRHEGGAEVQGEGQPVSPRQEGDDGVWSDVHQVSLAMTQSQFTVSGNHRHQCQFIIQFLSDDHKKTG